MKRYVFLLLSLALLACENEGVVFSPVPEIKLLSISSTQVQAQKDSIVFEIEYTDGDGDLGTNDDQIRNLFLTDQRINLVHEFRVQQLAPDGADIPITGSLNIVLPNTLITDSSTQQSVTFTLYVVDRAGNESNVVESPEIIVVQ